MSLQLWSLRPRVETFRYCDYDHATTVQNITFGLLTISTTTIVEWFIRQSSRRTACDGLSGNNAECCGCCSVRRWFADNSRQATGHAVVHRSFFSVDVIKFPSTSFSPLAHWLAYRGSQGSWRRLGRLRYTVPCDSWWMFSIFNVYYIFICRHRYNKQYIEQ